MNKKIVGLSLDIEVLLKLDQVRGLAPRSTIVSEIIKDYLEKKYD